MRARSLLLLLLAVMLAGGTALLARSWLNAQRVREVAESAPLLAPRPAKSVLVARADLKRGQILRPEELVWQVWPDGALDKNYIIMGGPRTPDAFAGWVAKNPIAGGEPVTESKIIAPGDRGFLAAVLRPGMRAISVPVNNTTGISGFIFPGDQVDVLLTYSVPSTSTGKEAGTSEAEKYQHKVAETVLSNVRVIGIDQRLENKPGEAVVAHTVTFEVTPKQAEAIAVAQDLPTAKLSLSLRSIVPDAEATATEGTSAGRDSAVMSPAAGAPAVKLAADRTSVPTSDSLPVAVQATAVVASHPAPAAANRAADSGVRNAATGAAKAVSPTATPGDGSIGTKATYTLDHEISSLLPKPKGDKNENEIPKLWICKGSPLACNNPAAGSEGDRFLEAFKELKSQGAAYTPGR